MLIGWTSGIEYGVEHANYGGNMCRVPNAVRLYEGKDLASANRISVSNASLYLSIASVPMAALESTIIS